MANSNFTRRRFLSRVAAGGLGGVWLRPAIVAAAGRASNTTYVQQPGTLVTATPWQIGCYTRPWDQFEFRVALDAIAEAGYQYAGLMTAKGKGGLVISVATSLEEARQVGEEVRQRGLKPLSVYGGDFPVAASIAAGIAGLKKLIDNCVACGAPHLMLGGTGNEKLQEPYYQVVRECCDYAAAKHIGLSVKPHGGLNATGPQCRKIIERVNHKSFGLWYDPGNIYYYSNGELDPVDDATTVDGLVVGMSIKDYVHPKEVLVTPGDGKVDFGRVMAMLKRGGFISGPLIVECLARGDLQRLLSAAKRARLLVERLASQR